MEVTVRYSAKPRAARVRRDARAPMLACLIIDEPIDEMMSEDSTVLTHRFARSLLGCPDAGAHDGLLDPGKVQAVKAAVERGIGAA